MSVSSVSSSPGGVGVGPAQTGLPFGGAEGAGDLHAVGRQPHLGKTILEQGISSVEQISELLNLVDNSKQQRLISALSLVEESWDESGCMKLIIQFVKKGQRRRDRQILERIKAAEKENDQETLIRLLREKQKLAVRSQNQRLA